MTCKEVSCEACHIEMGAFLYLYLNLISRCSIWHNTLLVLLLLQNEVLIAISHHDPTTPPYLPLRCNPRWSLAGPSRAGIPCIEPLCEYVTKTRATCYSLGTQRFFFFFFLWGNLWGRRAIEVSGDFLCTPTRSCAEDWACHKP